MKCIAITIALLMLTSSVSGLLIKEPLPNLLVKADAKDSKKRALLKKIYNNLLSMVFKGNGKIGKISLAFGSNDNERYMVALDKIKRGETIVKIPENMLYSADHPEIKKYCAQFNDLITNKELRHNGDELCLQLWVLNERKNIAKSQFQNFIAFLPNKFTNFPLLYDNKDKKLLEGYYLLDIMESEQNFLDEDYNTLKRHKLLQKINRKDFYQAYTIFESRSYQFTDSKGKQVSAYVPLVDLFNYKTGKEQGNHKVSWKFDATTRTFNVYAFEDIDKGSKLYIEYGNHSNLQFLLYYGFTYAKPAEKTEYNIYVGSGDEQVIADLNGDLDLMKTLEPVRHSIPGAKKGEEGKVDFISMGNEVKSLEKLYKELAAKVKGYKTNLEQDQNKLKNSVSENEINILRVTIEERKIFEGYKKMVEVFLDILKGRTRGKINPRYSKLLVIDSAYRAYYGMLNDRFQLGIKLSMR